MFIKKSKKPDFTKQICWWIIIAMLLTVILLCFSKGINGNDFWWHIKVGEWVVEHNEVPTTDIFSWYGVETNLPWTAHEWLADVVFYGVFHVFGEIGVFLFCLSAALLLLILIIRYARKYIEGNFIVSGVFLAFFAVVASLFFYGRPHIFSYFLLFFELNILYEFTENNNSNKIFLIPILAILWSNLHGGSASLVYVLCLLFLISGLFSFSCERLISTRFERNAIIKLLFVTLGSALGILVNPIGLRVFTYPYINLSDTISMSVISEWQAPDAKSLGNLILYFLPIFIMVLGVLCTKKDIRLIDLLMMLAFLFLFFRSARFIMLWYIAAAFCAFRYMPKATIKRVTKPAEKIALFSLIGLLCVPCYLSLSDAVETHKNNNLISKTMSPEAIEVIKKDAPERLYNDYNLGEALIYHDIPVFFDSRADLYAQEGILADGVSLMYLEPTNTSSSFDYMDVDGVIQKYGFDAMLLLKGRALYSYVVSHPERFSLVYEDATLGYFRVCGGLKNE